MLRLRYFLLAGLLPAIPIQHGLAADNWDLCRIPTYEFVGIDGADPDATAIEAQSIVSENSDQVHLTGEVSITRAQQKIRADEVFIDKSTQAMQASGNVVFEDPSYRLRSPAIQVDNSNHQALFSAAEFELPNRHGRGQADEIKKLDQARSQYQNLFYTTCDPADSDWHLTAREMEIDDDTGRGTARHTTLYFKEIPFLYLPWFQFPVDDRRLSGVLAPRFGYSDSRGANIALPVYWNMAPDYDMTITPAWYNDRGAQLNTENRYLFKAHQGQIDLSYLDDDEDTDDSRWFQQWRHGTNLAYDINAELLLADVSDGEFFDDFENIAPQYNDISHLEQHFNLARSGENWRSALQWQDYQTLDSSTAAEDRPYARLPRLTLESKPLVFVDATETLLQTEWVRFERDDSVTGTRANIVTSLSWKASNSWYFFEPELQLAYTDYQLEDNPGGDSIYRNLPTLGIDTGLIFERLAGSQNQWLQTFEPRLYFLYTPYENQGDIPDFDTSLVSSTYSNLFRNNRFIGADRIGDASQVSFGLGSRIYNNESGDELFHARAGQIVYFKDRRVSLDGSRDTESRSDVIAEIDIWPSSSIKIASRLVYDQEKSEVDDRDLSFNYSKDGYAANLGYYFTEDELEQTLLSFVYPVNERWTMVVKIHRSLLFDEPVENLFGLSYESCCWGLKILAGQTGDEIDNFAETDESIYFEITLKGLSQAGQDIDSQLHRAIPGYAPEF